MLCMEAPEANILVCKGYKCAQDISAQIIVYAKIKHSNDEQYQTIYSSKSMLSMPDTHGDTLKDHGTKTRVAARVHG